MSKYLVKPVQPFTLARGESIATLLDKMGGTSFQARSLSRALEIWVKMLKDKASILLGLAGAMVPAGMRQVIAYLIENRLIDCLVSTGANLFHDCHETLGYYHWQGSEKVDDLALRNEGIDRIYDTFALEGEFKKVDSFVTEWSATLEQERPYTTREFLYRLGEKLSENSDQRGILTSAFRKKLPIYCPAIGDSSIGIALAEGRVKGTNRIIFDVVQDVIELTQIVTSSPSTGVIYIGGGTPKNFIQQTTILAPVIFQWQGEGHKYAIQITTDSPQWGGLSGCSFEEAQSWGKIAQKALKTTVCCDATIALPLLVSGLTEKIGEVERGLRLEFSMGEALEVSHC